MEQSNNIRNFIIISHIDHGKSTLADRFLELTGAVDARHMKPQYLDQLDLERERGITIKMAPVRMRYGLTTNNQQPTTGKGHKSSVVSRKSSDSEYILNLIDTPGHSDFSYEVSRALAAVEGAILLVDASQGVQAQTWANLEKAKKAGLAIIGAVNKIDIASVEQIENSIKELARLLNVELGEIFKISAKTGQGVKELLEVIVRQVPSPERPTSPVPQALIFDSLYDEHKGIIAFVRIFSGSYSSGEKAKLVVAKEEFKIKEVGYFAPELKVCQKLLEGEIGYIATGIKDPDRLKIGDTIGNAALGGYREPKPVVFVSLYPDEASEYDDLKTALQKLKLNDSALMFSSDMNEVLGRGFKCGFLGKLHFEITAERLEKEFKIDTISTFPSVAYKIKIKDEYIIIENPDALPACAGRPPDYSEILEPMIKIEILVPIKHFNNVLRLKENFQMENVKTHDMEGKILITADMPLFSLISDFDDKLKSVSEGMASFSYELAGYRKADLEKVEILVNGSVVPGLTQFVYKDLLETKPRRLLKKLKELLPRQQFSQALQARVNGKIISRETISAMRKDVTGYLYGGDRTRKMKLWKKQKRGKEKLLKMSGAVKIPVKIFKDLLK